MTEKKDAVEQVIEKSKPILANIGMGGIVGFTSGIALKKIGKALAVVIGTGFIGLQLASVMGFVDVKWDHVAQSAKTKMDVNQDALEAAMLILEKQNSTKVALRLFDQLQKKGSAEIDLTIRSYNCLIHLTQFNDNRNQAIAVLKHALKVSGRNSKLMASFFMRQSLIEYCTLSYFRRTPANACASLTLYLLMRSGGHK